MGTRSRDRWPRFRIQPRNKFAAFADNDLRQVPHSAHLDRIALQSQLPTGGNHATTEDPMTQTLTAVAASATVKPHAPTTADLTPIGMTAEQFKALPGAAQAACIRALAAVNAAEAKRNAPANKLAVVVYADCSAGGVNAAGVPKNCRIPLGADKCEHGNTFKGNLGITGLGKFPTTLYAGQWLRFAEHWEALKTEAERIVAAGFGTK
jgi:hypothetical protein